MAIRMAQEVASHHDGVDVRVVSLGSPTGREEARREGILSVPTVIVGNIRFIGVPEWEALENAVIKMLNGNM